MGEDESLTNTLVSIDPGRDKCGFAALSTNGEVLFKKVIATQDLEKEIAEHREKFNFDTIVIGNGTTSKIAKGRIESAFSDLTIKVIDEYKTTEMARGEYFKENPPKGWRKFIPVTMQTPPVPVDDYVAVILAKKYLGSDKL